MTFHCPDKFLDLIAFHSSGSNVKHNGHIRPFRFLVDHLMAANGRDMSLWEKDMQELAKCENLWFDITALPWNIREEYPYPTCSEYVKQAMKMVGSQRMIWGSDVPSLLLIDKYQKHPRPASVQASLLSSLRLC